MPRPSVLLALLASCALPTAEDPTAGPPAPPAEARVAVVEPVPLRVVEVRDLEPAPPESARLDTRDATFAHAANAALAESTARRVAVTLDRPLYRPGETVWARIWDLAAPTLDRPAAGSDVVVELLDPRGAVVVGHAYPHTGAGAAAAFDLPAGIPGGLYTLRASVGREQVERPFVVAAFEEPRIRKELDLLRDAYGPGDEVVAALKVASSGRGPLVDREVKVIVEVDGRALPPILARTDTRGEATLRFDLPDAIARPDALVTVIVDEDGWSESISREIPVVLDAVRIEWFPEGGELVDGLPSRMYLRARGPDGLAADVAGVIEDDRGREVARFRTVHDGLGRFEFVPERGRRYQARLTEPAGSSGAHPLVAARRDGCVLRAYDDLDGKRPELRVGVQCTEDRRVVVTGGLRGHAFVPAEVVAGPVAPAVVHLRTDAAARDLAQGVARITLLSDALEPIAERLVYRNRKRALDVSIAPDRTKYGPRDEVVLAITARDADGGPVDADLAVAVADDRVLKFADDEHGNLLSRIHLEPWISGMPEDPAWYFDPEEPDAGRGLDLVLGTFGWRRLTRPVASNDAGEGAKAKAVKLSLDRGSALEGPFQPPPAPLQGGIGGLIGIAGGGLGGGGLAEGLGGLGGRGMGGDASGSGWGKGSGSFGAKGEGGLGAMGTDPIILGALDRTLIDEVIKRHMNQIRYCYQRELTKHPELQGKIVIKFTIGKDGTVSAASTKSTTMNSSSVESCIVGRFLRMQFGPPKGGGIVIVSYPFHFSTGRPPNPYATVREFAHPDYTGKPPPAVRTDFRSTVGWFPSVRTGPDGQALVRFFLDDQLTTFRVVAEGAGGGEAGRAEAEVHSQLPFSLDVPLPLEVTFGDRLLLPVRLSNRRSEPLSVALTTKIGAPLAAEDGAGDQELSLLAGTGATTVVPIAVPDGIGKADIEVTASAASLTDRMARTLSIAPRGFPARWTGAGALEDRAVHAVSLDDPLPGGTEAKLTLYTTPLSTMLEGLESMVRIPHGCFEQTSSTNHPNVMVLRYLDRTGGGAGLRVDRTEALREGYSRLKGYQVGPGGFETWGEGPGKEALSAYGLLQFTRMREVYPSLDPSVLERDVAYLLAARDGTGGYTQTGTSSHLYGAAPKPVNDAYVTFALAETGHLRPGPELEQQEAVARTTKDPYLLALATLTLQRFPDDRTVAAADRLAALQAADGSFPGAATSVSGSGGADLLVETTALAVLALQRPGGHAAAVDRAVRFLASARRGSAGWGGTQATVLALEALSAVPGDAVPKRGEVVVRVDGRPVRTLSYDGTEANGLVADLSAELARGAHEVELVHRGERPIHYALEATWRRDTPADAPDAPLAIETELARAEVPLGETTRLVARIENTSGSGAGSPIARIGLPAGVRAETWQLEALKERGRIAFFETRPREVTLYWDGMAPGEVQEIALDLVTEVPGTFTAPPSQVHPYYTTDAKRWAEGPTLRILP